MIIAVNARLLLKDRLEGVGNFAFEVLQRITREHPEHTFYFIFDRPFHTDFIFSKNVIPIQLGPPARHPFLWYIFFEISTALYLKMLKPDLYFSPENYMPLAIDCPSVITMHDLAFEHFPNSVSRLTSQYYRHFFSRFAKRCKAILTVSEFSKNDIITQYGLESTKIKVVGNGWKKSFHQEPADIQNLTQAKYNIFGQYFIYLGALYSRKNLINLVHAFNQFRSKTVEAVQLVIIGSLKTASQELIDLIAVSPYASDIEMLGRVNDQKEVNALISGAIAMTYVSLFEGFGVPCLEAMACDTPVICSNTSSMPEVCGDAALYIDPTSVDDIADKMLEILISPSLRHDLTEKGKLRLAKFDWDITASMVWNSLITAVPNENNNH